MVEKRSTAYVTQTTGHRCIGAHRGTPIKSQGRLRQTQGQTTSLSEVLTIMGVVQTVVSGDENSVVAEVVMPASAQRHYGASAKLSHVTPRSRAPPVDVS